jgi:DNA-binding winged helix-turn-helix (wHTH) protein
MVETVRGAGYRLTTQVTVPSLGAGAPATNAKGFGGEEKCA